MVIGNGRGSVVGEVGGTVVGGVVMGTVVGFVVGIEVLGAVVRAVAGVFVAGTVVVRAAVVRLVTTVEVARVEGLEVVGGTEMVGRGVALPVARGVQVEDGVALSVS